MKLNFPLILLILSPFLLHTQTQTECKTEFCRIIREQSEKLKDLEKQLKEKDETIKAQKATIASQEAIIKSQQQTIAGLRKLVSYQRKIIDSLTQINRRELEGQKLAEKKMKSLEDSISKVELANQQLGLQKEKDQIRLSEVEQENKSLQRTINEIGMYNFIFDPNYIVPYGLPIGPIEFNNDFAINPQEEAANFLHQLRKTVDNINVVVEIFAEGKRRDERKLKEALVDQMKNYCPSCRFTFRFSLGNKDQIYLKLYHNKNAPIKP